MTDYGVWYVVQVNGWIYGVCTNADYPERHAYGLIGVIKNFI